MEISLDEFGYNVLNLHFYRFKINVLQTAKNVTLLKDKCFGPNFFLVYSLCGQ